MKRRARIRDRAKNPVLTIFYRHLDFDIGGPGWAPPRLVLVLLGAEQESSGTHTDSGSGREADPRHYREMTSKFFLSEV